MIARVILFLYIMMFPANAIELQKFYKEPLTETDKKGS